MVSVHQTSMRFSSVDRLIFVASFMVFMNWGVRLTNVVINAF